VNLATGEVQIRQQLQRVGKELILQEPKTEKSRRTLILPKVCIQALRQHRKRQLKDRLKAGAAWANSGLVFTTYADRGDGRKRGGPLHPRNVLRALHAILKAANTTENGIAIVAPLPRLRFHDLRHSAASLLIASGVELAEVSMLLGHSELRVTMDFYAHLQKQTATKAATRMDSILVGG
jgi:integrase